MQVDNICYWLMLGAICWVTAHLWGLLICFFTLLFIFITGCWGLAMREKLEIDAFAKKHNVEYGLNKNKTVTKDATE